MNVANPHAAKSGENPLPLITTLLERGLVEEEVERF